jgi:hypothetical protein
VVDFRYHLVSILAVFVALAIGIVLGTTVLSGALLDNLRSNISSLTQDKEELRGQVGGLQEEAAAADDFVQAAAPALLAGRLPGARVVVIGAPGAAGDVRDAVADAVEQAGGTVTAQVLLQDAYVERPGDELAEVLDALAPVGLAPPPGPVEQRMALALATGVLGPAGAASGETSVSAGTVLDELEGAGLLRVQGSAQPPATLAVLVAAPAPEEVDEAQDEDRETAALLAVAAALSDRARGTVVTGPVSAAETPGMLGALRDDAELSADVAGVDGGERTAGAVATVYALIEAVAGEPGQYGRGPGAQGPLPSPLPDPLPAPANAPAAEDTGDPQAEGRETGGLAAVARALLFGA